MQFTLAKLQNLNQDLDQDLDFDFDFDLSIFSELNTSNGEQNVP